jgi:predicted amino acid dehydrogenase
LTREIVSVSLGPSSRDYELTAQMFGQEFHVRRFGVNGDLARARELVARFDEKVDAIGLGGMRRCFQVGSRTYVQQQVQQVAQPAQTTPVVDGGNVKGTLERWAISQVAQQQPGILTQKRVFILSGIDGYALAQILSGYTDQILFGDPIFQLNLPFALRSFQQLTWYADLVLPALLRAGRIGPCAGAYRQDRQAGPSGLRPRGWTRGARYFGQAHVIAGHSCLLRQFAPGSLQGKIIMTGSLSGADLQDLAGRGIEALITLTPPLSSAQPYVGDEVIEAALITLKDRPSLSEANAWPVPDVILARDEAWSVDQALNLVATSEIEPQIRVLNPPRDVNRFAFVIHPLSVDSIFNHPQLKYLRFLPKRLVERLLANIRPLYLSRITGIRSPATGQEVEGYLLGLGATPRELMRRKPGFAYRRLIVASRMAQQKGARIMGLGAFTKVVGDAGITVAYKSDIAITSGNSLTVVATLEAAKRAVLLMGGRTDRGRAVVIGATGSIGSVCSRLLAQAVRDVVLVAPRPEKLIPLKRTIEAETPGARVTITTQASPHLASADLVVTTTTAIGQKVIDVLSLKPGCVVCDVARPPDVREEEAQLRPDVLVIESGEILLPGEPDFGFDIGLPPGVAYACLAEAAVLAMEGRFENFTLGRNIEIDKVKEMYRLFLKHGLELEGLRSFGRYVSDSELDRKRELADDLRRHPEKLESLIAQAAQAETSKTPLRALPSRVFGHPALWLAAVGAMAAVAGLLLSRRKGRGS